MALALGPLLAACVDRAPAPPPAQAGALPVQLGPRPYFLVDQMPEGPLKADLQACAARTTVFRPSRFAIGHRGAALQFPEHTRESYVAAARQGAGLVECDVTFTRDKALVCRHAQDDLHTTTDILATPLAERCTRPFEPARFGPEGELIAPARAECRTSDLTLAEFRTLRGKMDASNPRARTVAEYLGGTAPWRTDLYAGPGSGTLMTFRESIALMRTLGVDLIPELKAPVVPMPYEGMSQADYAQRLVDELKAAGVPPQRVWLQSFRWEDVRHWLREAPDYARQAVLLDGARTPADLPDAAALAARQAEGLRWWAPPLFALLAQEGGRVVPSPTARAAREAGLGLFTWTLERSGVLRDGDNGYYFQGLAGAVRGDGDVMTVLDVLAREVGVRGVFSDWPATVAFYAHCRGLD